MVGDPLLNPFEQVPDEEALARLQQAEERLAKEEEEQGLEYVGPGSGMNRKERREMEKRIKRWTRNPQAVLRLRHPLLQTLTPYGARKLRIRRARARIARATRHDQQRQAALARRLRQRRRSRAAA